MKRFAVILLAGTMLFAASSWGVADDPPADEPPVRLKKKEKLKEQPPPDDKPKERLRDPKEKTDKDKPEKPDADKPDPDPVVEEGEKEVLDRIARNLQDASKRLAEKDAGDTTRQIQAEIVKDLDRLIQQAQNPPQANQQDQSQGGGGEQEQQQLTRKPSSQGGAGSRRERREQARNQSGNSGPMAGGRKPDQGDKPGGASNDGGRGGDGMTGPSKVADLYKDIWGHLPETVRQELEMYYRERYMPKYDDLLRQYYSTLAEKGRKKGD